MQAFELQVAPVIDGVVHAAHDYLTHIITFVRNTCFTHAGVRCTANG